jgi:hypothetical protein
MFALLRYLSNNHFIAAFTHRYDVIESGFSGKNAWRSLRGFRAAPHYPILSEQESNSCSRRRLRPVKHLAGYRPA